MGKPKPSKRKSKLFSVSFKPEDLEELSEFLEAMGKETGTAFSRNEIIRRSMLAHIRYVKQKGKKKAYTKIFKDVK